MTDPLRVLIDGEFVDIERADVDVDADLELAEEDVPPPNLPVFDVADEPFVPLNPDKPPSCLS